MSCNIQLLAKHQVKLMCKTVPIWLWKSGNMGTSWPLYFSLLYCIALLKLRCCCKPSKPSINPATIWTDLLLYTWVVGGDQYSSCSACTAGTQRIYIFPVEIKSFARYWRNTGKKSFNWLHNEINVNFKKLMQIRDVCALYIVYKGFITCQQT